MVNGKKAGIDIIKGLIILYVSLYFQNNLYCFYNRKKNNKTRTYKEKNTNI